MSRLIHVVGNSVKIPEIRLLSKHLDTNNIVFVGKMSYEPNIVAVTYFATHIFPKLKKSCSNLKFTIVGAAPSPQVVELKEIPGIEITGFVDSVESYFQNALIVVAPMLTGAGIQNKIIQAMSYGCCVATTPVGAEGLNIQNNEIAILSGDQDWVECLDTLIANRELRIGMGKRARAYVENNLTYERISKEFWEFIDSGFKNM